MNKPTKTQMQWFVTRLIEIRKDLNLTPDHIADIKFDWREIMRQRGIFNIRSNQAAKNKVDEMLSRIKGDGEFLDSFHHFNKKRLSWDVRGNSIKGFQTGLLTAYLDKINDIKQIGTPTDKLKIIFKNNSGDYYFNGGNAPRILKLKRSTLYYAVIDAIYSLAPEGGTISFNDFAGSVGLKIRRKLTNKDDNGKCKVIRSYVTDKSNGFLRASEIKDTTFGGKPLIECVPGTGIIFNNRK